jgi:hypothetical protein
MRVITKGSRVGVCNICGVYGPLTDDHVPPKGASRLTQVEMMHIVDMLRAERPRYGTRFSQNGVKYRTLCATCNNRRLGHHYDPSLVALSRDVRRYLESTLSLPAETLFETKPNRLARSVVGHLLAQGVGEHRSGQIMEELTDYFLDEAAPFPSRLKLYYWVYPYNDQVAIKAATFSPYYWKSFSVFMLLKFFPLSFFVLSDEPPEWMIPYRRLDALLTSDIDRLIMLPVDFHNLPPRRWPEAPGKEGVVMHCKGSIGAIPR